MIVIGTYIVSYIIFTRYVIRVRSHAMLVFNHLLLIVRIVCLTFDSVSFFYIIFSRLRFSSGFFGAFFNLNVNSLLQY